MTGLAQHPFLIVGHLRGHSIQNHFSTREIGGIEETIYPRLTASGKRQQYDARL